MTDFEVFRTLQSQRMEIVEEAEVDDDADADSLEKFSYERWLELHGEDDIKSMIGFSNDEFQSLVDLLEPVLTQEGRGKRFLCPQDSFAVFLTWATSGMTFQELHMHLHLPASTIKNTVDRVISSTKDILIQQLIPTSITECAPRLTFINFDEAWGAVDATVVEICRPSDNEIQKQYYDGKHCFHSVKFQVLVSPEGRVLHLSQVVKGTMHDKKLFDLSGLEKFCKMPNVVNDVLVERVPILADSGYTGIRETFPEAVVVFKKGRGGSLSANRKDINRLISEDRIVVEHFFSRLKVLFGIISSKFRGKITML